MQFLKDKRLSKVFELLGSAHTAADVGCDHGYLSAQLIVSGAAKTAVASDISAASVGKAARLAKRLGIEDRMICAEGDGLKPAAPYSPDKIAVCGMGGELIARILEEGAETAQNAELIVMQPMRGEAELRRYLYENGFGIADELVVREGRRFYQVIAASYGKADVIPDGFPKGWFRFGWVMANKRDPQLVSLLYHYRSVYKRELEKAQKKGVCPDGLEEELERTDRLLAFMTGGEK